MRQKKWKYISILLGTVLCFFVAPGCGKSGTDAPVPTQNAEQSATPMPTQQQPETELTSTPGVEPTLTPAPTSILAPVETLTPEPVTFPVEINEITFTEALLRKKALAADADGDGCLSKEEAESVTKLSFKKLMDSRDDGEAPWPDYTVEDFSFDFEGIQYFTELTELKVNLLGGEVFVAGHSMEDDIPATAKNFQRVYECTKLQKLSLCETDLVSIALSEFPDLKRLELSCMYNLERLDWGENKKLSALWISECHKLESLDVSGLEKLKTLDIVRNDSLKDIRFGEENQKLETIQLNGLPGMEVIDVTVLKKLKSLNLMDVGLAGLDVSKNAELEQLCAEGLHLDVLDVRNNPKLSYMINDGDSFRSILLPEENRIDMIRWTNSGVTEFPVKNLNPETLTGIDIQGTAIKELDVSMYPNLEYLYYDEDVTKIKR